MAIYVIGYDLHPKAGETYEELIKAIQNVGTNWWHCLDSTWLVVSDKTAIEIRDVLWEHMRGDDQLLVVAYSRPGAWNGFNQECGDWLKKNL